jgi:hypothetical protein
MAMSLNYEAAPRYGRSALRHLGIEPFRDAAEVWFWYCAALAARRDGWTTPRTIRSGSLRPCELVDVARPIPHLVARGQLTEAQLRVLRIYGDQQREPVRGHTAAEDRDAALWYAALARLEIEWRSVGILEPVA